MILGARNNSWFIEDKRLRARGKESETTLSWQQVANGWSPRPSGHREHTHQSPRLRFSAAMTRLFPRRSNIFCPRSFWRTLFWWVLVSWCARSETSADGTIGASTAAVRSSNLLKNPKLAARDLLDQRKQLVEIAKRRLDPSPLRTVGFQNLVARAKGKTAEIFRDIDPTLLPTPAPFV